MGNTTGYNLRLKSNIFRRIKYISKKNHRSLNSQITLMVEELINNFEKVNGKISEEELTESEKDVYEFPGLGKIAEKKSEYDANK